MAFGMFVDSPRDASLPHSQPCVNIDFKYETSITHQTTRYEESLYEKYFWQTGHDDVASNIQRDRGDEMSKQLSETVKNIQFNLYKYPTYTQ